MLLAASLANASGKYQLVLVDYGHKEWPMEITSHWIHGFKKALLKKHNVDDKVANDYWARIIG